MKLFFAVIILFSGLQSQALTFRIENTTEAQVTVFVKALSMDSKQVIQDLGAVVVRGHEREEPEYNFSGLSDYFLLAWESIDANGRPVCYKEEIPVRNSDMAILRFTGRQEFKVVTCLSGRR